jgi:hypothetical protein
MVKTTTKTQPQTTHTAVENIVRILRILNSYDFSVEILFYFYYIYIITVQYCITVLVQSQWNGILLVNTADYNSDE